MIIPVELFGDIDEFVEPRGEPEVCPSGKLAEAKLVLLLLLLLGE